jgi:hypothetical protein
MVFIIGGENIQGKAAIVESRSCRWHGVRHEMGGTHNHPNQLRRFRYISR